MVRVSLCWICRKGRIRWWRGWKCLPTSAARWGDTRMEGVWMQRNHKEAISIWRVFIIVISILGMVTMSMAECQIPPPRTTVPLCRETTVKNRSAPRRRTPKAGLPRPKHFCRTETRNWLIGSRLKISRLMLLKKCLELKRIAMSRIMFKIWWRLSRARPTKTTRCKRRRRSFRSR